MTNQTSQNADVDLDKTDQLPILKLALGEDPEDEAVPMDRTAVLASPAPVGAPAPEFVRPSVDLPSLAESVRSVEERIARQNAEFEALSRAHERAREAESAAVSRAQALAVELASVRTALEAEQARARDMERTLAERNMAMEAARVRVEEALRESDRHQGESQTLRDSLAVRDASIAQALRSLGERDAQLAALQAEHAKMVPVLEATSKSTTQLDAELQSSRAHANALSQELAAGRDAAGALKVELKRSESQLSATSAELTLAKSQAESFLELLCTREWRRGFDQNMFREMDAQVGAANADHGALEAERARLHARVVALEEKITAQAEAAQAEQSRLAAELAVREKIIADTHARGSAEEQRIAELIECAQRHEADHAAQMAALRTEQGAEIARLQAEGETREQEMAVLMAHLQEARRPVQSIEADVKGLTEALEAKTAAFQHLEEEHRNVRGVLERTRGQLQEREFLIRRLERSESNNANVLGRIQTSIERLGNGSPAHGAGAAGAAADWSAELIRIDGDHPVTHVLSRRTRIGRAAGCELQIDSGSVSRHHALVMVGPRETLIEDLNSTNGVFVNGRKVSRQSLSDGDAVTIGETQFRYVARLVPHPAEPAPTEH
jgi:chromosome segregation ATPase